MTDTPNKTLQRADIGTDETGVTADNGMTTEADQGMKGAREETISERNERKMTDVGKKQGKIDMVITLSTVSLVAVVKSNGENKQRKM